MTVAELTNRAMVEEARLALQAYAAGNRAAFLVHRANARRIADALGLSARPQREEVAA